MVKFYSIKEDFVNARLDRWFKKVVCEIPQSLLEKNLRKGNIKVNKKKIKSSYKLNANDKIFIYNFNFTITKGKIKKDKYQPSKKELSRSSSIIIENNDNFVVINKPSGIAVQSGTKSKRNIVDIIAKTKEFQESVPYIVHRIDKDTSGILIIAKNRKYAQLFTSLFRIRKIHKTYLCVALGEFKTNKGTLIDNLFYYEGKKEIITKAITHYRVLDSNTNYSLLNLNPETGRKHQLRKQLLLHGHPVLGDTKYRISKDYIKGKNLLMLHAYKIKFSISGMKYNFSTKPPSNFLNTLKEKYLKSSF